jgi:Ca2+-binding EF-hand superfamily protein
VGNFNQEFYSEIEKMAKKFELPPEEIAELKEAFNLFDKVNLVKPTL